MTESPSAAALTFANIFLHAMHTLNPSHQGFDLSLCAALSLVSASFGPPTPRVVGRLTVTRAMCNPSGTLHGGAIATLFDVCTTVALATARKWEVPGVTRTLSTTCLVPVYPGEEIEVVGEVVQVGRKLAHLLGKMTLVKNGKLVATAVHDKANVDVPAATSSRMPKL